MGGHCRKLHGKWPRASCYFQLCSSPPGGQGGEATPQQESTPASEGESVPVQETGGLPVPVQETGDPGEGGGEGEGEGTGAGEGVTEKKHSSK